MRVRGTSSLVAAVVLALTLAACGSSSSGGNASASGGAGNKSGPIKIGLMQDLSGPIGPYGQSQQQGVMVAVDEINAGGGINGRKVEVVTEDLASNKANASAATRKLASAGVAGIIGPTSSSALVVAAPVAKQLKTVIVCASSTEAFKEGVLNEWTFRVAPIEAPAFPSIMKDVLSAAGNPKRIALFYDAANNSSIQERQLLEQHAGDLGYQLVAVETSPEGQTDVNSQVSKVAAAKPDAIFVSHLVAESAAFMKGIRARGVKAPFIGGPPFSTAKIFQLAGAAGEGAITFVPFLPTASSTTVKDFVATYEAKHNAKPDLFAAEAYDATVVLMDGIKAAGSDNAEAVRAAIGKLKDIPATTGSITYQGGPDNTTPHYTLVKVEGGAFVEVK